jgi:hypothetical protein
MKKNYILLIAFFLLSTYSFSQTNTTDQLTSETANAVPASESAEKETVILSKKPLPSGQKVTQEVFYILNDKPVDRVKYQQHLDETTGKK